MDQLAIIGVSGSGGSVISARFLKKGANDFIVKPFCNEEFYLRINATISIGLTATLGPTLEATLDHADQLLYQAKNQGRNRVIVG